MLVKKSLAYAWIAAVNYVTFIIHLWSSEYGLQSSKHVLFWYFKVNADAWKRFTIKFFSGFISQLVFSYFIYQNLQLVFYSPKLKIQSL